MKKFDKYMMGIAELTAELSYCKRLKVGSVIAKDGRPLVTGYNGTISGTENCCEYFDTEKGRLTTSDFVIHAEQNAVFFAAKNGIKIEGTTIYITHAPCPNCSKAIVSAGIKRVVYAKKYKNDDGLDFLRDCGLELNMFSVC